MSWTDLRDALVPQGLAKSGVIAGFLGLLDPRAASTREVLRDSATRPSPGTRDGAPVRGRRARRSRALKGVTTPVFMMQGRRDFAFGMEQATERRTRALAGPKRALVRPLTATRRRPASRPTRAAMLAEGAALVRPVPRAASTAVDRSRSRCDLRPRAGRGSPSGSPGLPKVVTTSTAFAANVELSASPGSVQRDAARALTADRGLRLARRPG